MKTTIKELAIKMGTTYRFMGQLVNVLEKRGVIKMVEKKTVWGMPADSLAVGQKYWEVPDQIIIHLGNGDIIGTWKGD